MALEHRDSNPVLKIMFDGLNTHVSELFIENFSSPDLDNVDLDPLWTIRKRNGMSWLSRCPGTPGVNSTTPGAAGTMLQELYRPSEGEGYIIIIGIILAIVAPIVTRIAQMAVSRQREYLADASAVQLTRYSEGLAGALKKIQAKNAQKMKVSESVSHLFIYDPVKTELDSVFATHPPVEKRIALLQRM